MKIATEWKDYIVLSTANGEKMERIGGYNFFASRPSSDLEHK